MPARRTPRTTVPTLEQLEASRRVQIALSPEWTVEADLPDLDAFVLSGHLPNPCIAMVRRIERGVVDETDLSDDERKDLLMLQGHLIARHLREPDLLATMSLDEAVAWVVGHDTPDGWVPGKLSRQHRLAIWQALLFHAGMAVPIEDPEVLARMKDALQALTVADVLPFRPGTESPGPAGDGRPTGTGAQ